VTDGLSPGDEMRPRNELRGFNDAPRLYHVWFSTRRRKRLLAGDVDIQARQLLKRIAANKAMDLRECETMIDRVHLMVAARPQELPRQAKLLKGISARRLFQQFPDLKLDADTDHFCRRGFGYRELADDSEGVAWYIRTQKRRLSRYER
jgi:putative transposase